MKLAQKGRFAPPPSLPKHAQAVSQKLATWPDVHARTHWLLGDEHEVDGADFYVGQDEIGHIHLDGDTHIAVGENLGAALVAEGRAQAFRWNAKFVVLSIRTVREEKLALDLFQLAYERLCGTLSPAHL